MCGGVSHIDTFDPKDNRWAGTLIDAIGFGDNSAEMRRPVIPCLRTFRRYGQSGIPVSDWFPHLGGVIDEIALVRSMWCNESNHFPAAIECCTGHPGRQFDHPTLGSWVTHALGRANENLPAFVNIGRASAPVQLTGGYLGASVAATPFQPGATPIPNLNLPPSSTTAERDRQMQALQELNREFRERYAVNSDIAARCSLTNWLLECNSRHRRPWIFPTNPGTSSISTASVIPRPKTLAGSCCWCRLAERGVRFIQVCHAGGGNGAWDAHGDIRTQGPLCRATDQPIAGLIRDLKHARVAR